MPSCANSCSESAISGSMPTTPDVQFDASRPLLQTSEHARRQSWDSGTGDVEEHVLENVPTEPFVHLNCNNNGLSSGLPPLPSIQHRATSTVLGALCNGESSDKLQALVASSPSGESEVS